MQRGVRGKEKNDFVGKGYWKSGGLAIFSIIKGRGDSRKKGIMLRGTSDLCLNYVHLWDEEISKLEK